MGTGKPAKYELLRRSLVAQPGETVTLTFAELEAIIGAPLPESARTSGWWANLRGQQRAQMQACWSTGWRVAGTRLRTASPVVTFVRW